MIQNAKIITNPVFFILSQILFFTLFIYLINLGYKLCDSGKSIQSNLLIILLYTMLLSNVIFILIVYTNVL